MNYNSKAWREKREKVLAHYNYTCKNCGAGSERRLNVHHKNPSDYESEADYLNAKIEDLDVLCARCHMEEHDISTENRYPRRFPGKPFHYLNIGVACQQTGEILAHNAVCIEGEGDFYLAVDENALAILHEKGYTAIPDFPCRFKKWRHN